MGRRQKQRNVAKSPWIRAHTQRTVLFGVNLHKSSIKTQSHIGVVRHGTPDTFIPTNLSVTWRASEPPNARSQRGWGTFGACWTWRRQIVLEICKFILLTVPADTMARKRNDLSKSLFIIAKSDGELEAKPRSCGVKPKVFLSSYAAPKEWKPQTL